MIPGFGGHLLPSAFVGQRLGSPAAASADPAWRGRLARWREGARQLGPASPLRAVVDRAALPLLELLGLVPNRPAVFRRDCATVACRASNATVLVLVSSWGDQLDAFWRLGAVESAASGGSWCVLFSGTHLRVFPATRLHSRRCAEIDLDAAADEASTASVLLMLFGAAALGGTGPSALESLVGEAEQHAAGVCRSLRTGVLDASREILRALAARERTRPVADVFEQSLTIVYRLLFLLFAEARDLVPLWHPVYRDSYSVAALREAALDRRSAGLWDAMRAASRLAHAGCSAGGLEVTAFNGRLFSPGRTPLAERRGLDDRAAERAIVALSTRPSADREGLEPISYRDLGVEQLGAVYETLLDYAPHVRRHDRRRVDVELRPGSGVRKDTGTFYTPQPIVDHLVRDALAPLVSDATPERILNLKVLDPSMGSGAFLVGACQYLAGAYERALVAHGGCHAADIGSAERASIRRLVAERCLFGVDINPTAVQLARLSVWLTTLAADKPLTFLDHRLRVGDSLAGTWLSLLRTAPARRGAARDLPLFAEDATSDALGHAVPVRFRLATEPNDTAHQVREKERILAELTAPETPLGRWTRVADAWCAAWHADPPLPPKAFQGLADEILDGRGPLPRELTRDLLDRVQAASTARRLFHWELEFPEVFFDGDGRRRPDGGFDAIVGNPPWDMVRADTHGDQIEARAAAAALVRFARDSGVYGARAAGHVNRYQLFVERAVALARPGGRIGLVLPSGLLTDVGSAAVRRLLFTRCAVERLVGFDNRTATFPIHRSVRFVLLSACAGRPTTDVACRFGLVDMSSLDRAVTAEDRPDPAWYPVKVTPSLMTRLSADAFAIPEARCALDLQIAERAAALFKPLGSPDGWNARFGRELNATDDRHLLRTHRAGFPVFEGKSIEPFRIVPGGTRWSISESDAVSAIGPSALRSRLAYRDVAASTNRVTLIAAILPARSASTHTLFCLKASLAPRQQQLLCAVLNSLVVNFLVRQRVTTHVTTAVVERLPIPTEDQMPSDADALVAASRVLAQRDDLEAMATINALVARVYALTLDELDHVLEAFPLIPREHRSAIHDRFRTL